MRTLLNNIEMIRQADVKLDGLASEMKEFSFLFEKPKLISCDKICEVMYGIN